MAIYHLSAKLISRKAGRSATAAAAYRTAERIVDERTGEVHDYTKKRGVEHAEVVMPTGADWTPGRAELWNAVEAKNKRADAQIAREFVVALPDELTPEARRGLAVRFAREIADTYQVAADVCIHLPSKEGDNRNHHAHILTTTNTVQGQGLGNKARALDLVAHNMGGGTGTANAIDKLRQVWADLANQALERAGRAERIDHRSLEAQGIGRPPSQHVGPAVSGMARRGAPSEVAQRMGEQFTSRLYAAQAIDRIERELDRSILDLSGELADAIRAREERQGEAERPKGAERDGPAIRSSRFTAKRTEPATPPQKAGRPNFEAMPIETQCKAWDVMLNKMADARRTRIAGVEAKSLKRTKRREKAARASMAARPERPIGLLASLRQRAYDKAWSAWNEADNRKRELERQAINLSGRLRDAATGSMAWATRVLKRAEPELARRVETHREAERAARRRAEMQEREQKRQAKKDRGRSR